MLRYLACRNGNGGMRRGGAMPAALGRLALRQRGRSQRRWDAAHVLQGCSHSRLAGHASRVRLQRRGSLRLSRATRSPMPRRPRPLRKCLQWEPSSNAAQRDRSPTGLLDATTATRAASRSSTSGATCSWGSPHSTVEAAEPGCLAVLGYVLTQCTTGSHPRHPAPPRHGD